MWFELIYCRDIWFFVCKDSLGTEWSDDEQRNKEMNGITTPWQGHKILDDNNIWEHSSEAAIVCGYYLKELMQSVMVKMKVMVNLMLKDKMWHWDWVGCQQNVYGWYNLGTFPAPRRHCVMYVEHSWILAMMWTYFISFLTRILCNASCRKPTHIHSNNSYVTPFTFRLKIRKGKMFNILTVTQ